MYIVNELAEAVKGMSPEGATRQPAPETMIAQTARRLDINLPADMLEFYRTMNGMNRPTHPDNGWIRLWDLDSWHRVRDKPSLRETLLYTGLEDAIIFADH